MKVRNAGILARYFLQFEFNPSVEWAKSRIIGHKIMRARPALPDCIRGRKQTVGKTGGWSELKFALPMQWWF